MAVDVPMMKPFSRFMFPDTVVLYRKTSPVGRQGGWKPSERSEGVLLNASVQRALVDRTDASGRTYTTTVHTIRTVEDPEVDAGDEFVYRNHSLVVEGHAEPIGIGDVAWLTQCLETRS
jgi:hypothetical protein